MTNSVFWIFLLLCFPLSVFAADYNGLGNESVSSSDLAKYTAVDVSPEFKLKVQKMLDVRTPSMGNLAEDGKTMYIGWNVTGTRQVWQLNGPGRFPKQLTGGEDATYLEEVTGNGTKIFSRDVGGEENPGIYVMYPGEGELVELFKKAKVQTRFTHLSHDEKYFFFSANDQDPSFHTHYRFDLKTKKITEIFNEKGIWTINDVWTDEKYLLMNKHTGSTTSEIYLYHLDSKKLVPIIGHEDKEDYTASFATSPNDYIIQTNKISNFSRLYHLKNKKLTPIGKELKFDVESFSVDREHKKILYNVDENGYSKSYGIELPSFKPLQLPTFSKKIEQNFFGKTTRNGRYTTFTAMTYNEPRQSYVYDWKTKILTPWTFASTPEINTKNFTKAKLDYYQAKDGTQIPYFVRIPQICENKACPVIVNFHGGPEGKSYPGFDPINELFLEQGFIYAEPNVRGSSGMGKEWLECDNGPKRLQVISDIEDAGIELKKKYKATKIGITGGSYGGYSTFYGMTKFAGTYDAGVAIVGMTNLVSFLNNTAAYRRPLRISEYGDPEKDLEALKELSPLTHLNKLKSPLMIIQGVNDPRVPVGEALQFKKFADDKKIPVELILFADEGHGTSKRSNVAIEVAKTLDFFNRHLK